MRTAPMARAYSERAALRAPSAKSTKWRSAGRRATEIRRAAVAAVRAPVVALSPAIADEERAAALCSVLKLKGLRSTRRIQSTERAARSRHHYTHLMEALKQAVQAPASASHEAVVVRALHYIGQASGR